MLFCVVAAAVVVVCVVVYVVVCVVCVVCVVWCDILEKPVCTFKTSPCVPAPRPHVVTLAGVMPVHTGTF